MKKNFSYQSDWFGSVLAVSCAAHFIFLGAGSFWNGSPKYAVVEAPSSVEVVILKDEPKRRQEIKEKIITTQDPRPVKHHVVQKKEKLKKLIPKPVITPEKRGAIYEARPDYLKNPAPVYPEIAKEREWQGLVILQVLVTAEGEANEVQVLVSSGHRVLDDAALRAVRKWQFLPASIGMVRFESRVRVPVRFILEEGEK